MRKKKEVTDTVKNASNNSTISITPRGCFYPLLVIALCIRIYFGATVSLRASHKVLKIVLCQIPGLGKSNAPSHCTIKIWAEKIGYYKLNHRKAQARNWNIIIDASIQIGPNKCFVILGCPSDKVPQGRPLALDDCEPIMIKITDKLNGDLVASWLHECAKNIGSIDVICSDKGSDMLKGIRLFRSKNLNTLHIPDTAHRVANLIKNKLSNDDRWKDFKKSLTQARREMQHSSFTEALPPNMRAKARFMNVGAIIRWGTDMLKLHYSPPIEFQADYFQQYLGWIIEYQTDLKRWLMFIDIAETAKEVVRDGMTHNIETRYTESLAGIEMDIDGQVFSDEICQFLNSISQTLHLERVYIGSSEIIESFFGKMKRMEGDQTSFGFTSLVLAAAATVGSTSIEMIEQALSTVKTRNIQEWITSQIGTSIQSRRKKLKCSLQKIKFDMDTKTTGFLLGKAAGF